MFEYIIALCHSLILLVDRPQTARYTAFEYSAFIKKEFREPSLRSRQFVLSVIKHFHEFLNTMNLTHQMQIPLTSLFIRKIDTELPHNGA